MGLFDMSLLGGITNVMAFSQASLENTLGTIKEVHQTVFEIPVNVAQELGLPEEKSVALKRTHRRILEHIHAGVCGACGEVNQYVVKQAKIVNELANFSSVRPEPTIVKLDTNKSRRQKVNRG